MSIHDGNVNIQTASLSLEATGLCLKGGKMEFVMFMTGRKSGLPLALSISLDDAEALKRSIGDLLREQASMN